MCNTELKKTKKTKNKTSNNLLKMTYRAITQMWDLEFVRVPLCCFNDPQLIQSVQKSPH